MTWWMPSKTCSQPSHKKNRPNLERIQQKKQHFCSRFSKGNCTTNRFPPFQNMQKYLKNAKHVFKHLQKLLRKWVNIMKTFFSKPDSHSTIYTTGDVQVSRTQTAGICGWPAANSLNVTLHGFPRLWPFSAGNERFSFPQANLCYFHICWASKGQDTVQERHKRGRGGWERGDKDSLFVSGCCCVHLPLHM